MSILRSDRNQAQSIDLFSFTEGIDLDREFFSEEVAVEKAWAKAVAELGLISTAECDQITTTLEEALMLENKGEFPWRLEDEDIHMNLERFSTEKLGELGKRAHLGRSRNDLIATSLRLFAARTSREKMALLQNLLVKLLGQARSSAKILVPGLTHLQPAQPVRLGHILAGHANALLRDLHRLELAEGEALSYLPLGSAALSGTTLPINLSALADDLGFSAVSTNSIDAVSDRDFLLVQLQAFALLGVHISRLAEDLILWASPQFGFLQISSAWSTGSSIMPNKRNPDVLELARAKSARLIGIANSALVLMKGLPSAYNSDLHELKRDFIQANRELSGLLPILSQFIEAMGFSSERAELSLGHGHLLATEIANHLTDQGENFRDAYRQTAALVELAEARGFQVHEILPSEALALAPRLDVKFFAALNFESAVEARKNMGGTSLASLEATIQGILSAIK